MHRVQLEVRGVVQGVGFRPFVYNLATELDLRGFVQNQGSHVLVDVEGEAFAVHTFLERLASEPPPRAAIDGLTCHPAPLADFERFTIVASDAHAVDDVQISPDIATCDACLRELFDPRDRRYRYPFINCSSCGPRLTIVTGVPYDRTRTTMSRFVMCAECRGEYDNPRNRRFHAEPIACATCGPKLSVALEEVVAALNHGLIVAIKGLGGYHLACDATNGAAVSRLRTRKNREAKPLAIMLREEDARGLFEHMPLATALRSPQRPIVLIDAATWRAAHAPVVAPEIAAGCPSIGAMLPYTPLHYLLTHDFGHPLVMTSGNLTNEPIAFEDDDARVRLAGVADLFVAHDRPIHTRCDDSVVQVVTGSTAIVRRARGFAPSRIDLAEEVCAAVLAVGGHLKSSICLASGRHAHVSQHIGDLETVAAYEGLCEGVARYTRMLDIQPEIVAHDLHPEYLSTRFADSIVAERHIAVQHHCAHVMSCMAEHGVTEPVLGVAFDGAGLGTDGAVWGGEFLLIDGATSHRLAHLAYVPLPGGDAATREPWRMAVAHLTRASLPTNGIWSRPRIPSSSRRLLEQMIDGGAASPSTSSMGRLFDAVASLVGVRDFNAFEGHAAMELEAKASDSPGAGYAFDVMTRCDPWIVDPASVIREIVEDLERGRSPADISAGFHNAVATMIADVGARLARGAGVRRVALTGGVFQNARLTELAVRALSKHSIDVLLHRRVPCNDGGLSLGQALFAARVLRDGTSLPGSSVCA